MADLTHSDPYLGHLLGPVRWDIDGKDWAGSISCNSTAPKRECEPFRDGSRLKASVMARRYLAAIERAGRGIVLLHDRVADVGSSYALDLARHLLPALIEKRYVLAAPVLAFSPLVERESPSMQTALVKLPPEGYALIDVDGDGKAELCARAGSEMFCSRSVESPGRPGDAPTTSFEDLQSLPSRHGLSKLLAAAKAGPDEAPPLLADIDGDGATDSCRIEMSGVVCTSLAHHAGAVERLWLERTTGLSQSTAGLTDADGDGRADLCWGGSEGLRCALSTGAAFAKPRVWFAGSADRPVFGDINGDGRGDVCLRSSGAIQCAFSTGDSFTSTSTWLASARWRDDAWWGVGDINGDGRADLCTVTDGRVSCGLAP
jgi:hypothetical protein